MYCLCGRVVVTQMEKNDASLGDIKEKMDQISLAVSASVQSQRAKIYLVAGTSLIVAAYLCYSLGKRKGRSSKR